MHEGQSKTRNCQQLLKWVAHNEPRRKLKTSTSSESSSIPTHSPPLPCHPSKPERMFQSHQQLCPGCMAIRLWGQPCLYLSQKQPWEALKSTLGGFSAHHAGHTAGSYLLHQRGWGHFLCSDCCSLPNPPHQPQLTLEWGLMGIFRVSGKGKKDMDSETGAWFFPFIHKQLDQVLFLFVSGTLFLNELLFLILPEAPGVVAGDLNR